MIEYVIEMDASNVIDIVGYLKDAFKGAEAVEPQFDISIFHKA